MAAGAPTSVAVEIELTAGVWTAVTTSVRGETLEIKVGRERGGDPQPGTCSFDLDNVDGTYTPDNPLSSLYPNLVEGKRVRVVVVKGASTSTRFLGWITVLEPELGQFPNQSITRVEAVDLLGVFARMRLPEAIIGYTVGRGLATRFWPLTDSNSNTGCSELIGGSSLDRLAVRRLTSGGTVDFESDSSSPQTDSAFVTMTAGAGLWSTRAQFTRTFLDQFAFEIMLRPTSGSTGEAFAVSCGKGSTERAQVYYDGTGYAVRYIDATGAVSGSSFIAAAPGEWHYVALYNTGGNTFRLVVDAPLSDPSEVNTGAFIYNDLTHVSIGGAIDQSAGALSYTASSSASYGAQFALGGDLGASMAAGLGYIFDLAALGSASIALHPGSGFNPFFSTIKTGGRNGLEVLLDFARSQSGIAYHEYSADPQVVRVRERNAERSSTVALTLDSEGDLAAAPVLVREVGRKAGVANATNPTTSVTATDATNAATVGQATIDVNTNLRDEVELYSVASDALARTRDAKLRISQVTFDLWTAATDRYAAWFATRVGSRVRIDALPSTYLGVTYIDGYVAGWTEQPMIDGYPVTLDLDAAPYSDSVFDTARWGWGDGICTASALTSSGTSVTLTWTGGQLLSTSAGDYPMDIDINGERCTISSAPAAGTSPRTVTIVRGVAPTVARAHSAGDPVEVWDVGRWAF